MGKLEGERSARRERRGGRVSEMIEEGQRRRLERIDLEIAASRTSVTPVVAPIQKKTHRAAEVAVMKLKEGITSVQIANACREKLPAAICNRIAAIKDPEAALEAALKAFRETPVTETYPRFSRSRKPRTETITHTINGLYFLRNAGILG